MASHYRYWGQSLLRGSLGAMLLCCAAVAGAQSSSRDAPELLGQSFDFDVPAQKVSTAILDIAKQAQIQALMAGNVLDAYQAEGLNERLSLAEALDRVLSGTPYAYQQTGRNAIMVGTPEALQEQSAVAGQNTIGQRRHGIEEIIVTGQKREERIQDVPIAISAFSPEDLEAQKIEGGFDLLKGVPNVTFSKTNFSGYNFQIRGIGTQAVSATTDPGVAVSFNNTTLIVNRLFEQEYLDVERVEVLRGPQGTLFGRNATAGVINVISNKPELGVWDGMIDVEVGNYNTRRLRGFFNAPISDTLALRGAYASTKRDGFGTNEAAFEDTEFGDNVRPDVDGRDLWTGRLSLGWQPSDKLRFNLTWERFEEDDNRVRTSKQLCHRDDGPQTVGNFDWANAPPDVANTQYRSNTSQGCLPGSLYADEAFGTPNGASLPYINGLFWGAVFGGGFSNRNGVNTGSVMGLAPWSTFPPGFPVSGIVNPNVDPADAPCFFYTQPGAILTPTNLCQPDPYAGRTQSRNLRTIHSTIEPQYTAKADIVELSFDLELGDTLLLSSQTVYADDEYLATQDFNRFTTFPIFMDSAQACQTDLIDIFFNGCDPGGNLGGRYNVMPGGVYVDPQLGPSDSLLAQDLSRALSTQYNQEVRLVSSFSGPWNFSLGANFTRFRTRNDYFVFVNTLSLFTNFYPFNVEQTCEYDQPGGQIDAHCVYVDPNPLEDINGEGHNYFRSDNPYKLTSSAVFGELYWQATEALKLTAGLRLTWDRKVFTPVPSHLLLWDYTGFVAGEGAGPQECTTSLVSCELAGIAPDGRGSPALPDIVQEWHEPTGRVVADWSPDLRFTDESMFYASFSHGYKGGGANPPGIAPPAGLLNERASGAVAPRTFDPEYVNAYEIGTKNTLLGGALVLNGTAFYYDYTDYQVSKIVDRSAVNENLDAEVWGLELETVFAPSLDWQFNAAIGYLNTEIANGEESIDLMDRTQGGDQSFTTPDGIVYDSWEVLKPWIAQTSNCVIPTVVLEAVLTNDIENLGGLCPGGGVSGGRPYESSSVPGLGVEYDPRVDTPNGGAGFFADLSGNELPNSPQFTVALGGQYNFDLTRDWRATARVDYYWQDQSYARVYNTEYDRLKSWSNTNLSFWINNPVNGITIEAYVKNVFDETPITGTFTNSDDTGLTTNVFTLDPRLIGVSVRKEF